MSRSDLKEIGDTLQASTAALIVIGRSRLQEALADATKHAVSQFEKELRTDVEAFDKALTATVNQSLKAAQ
jgi:Sec-independent protein translocase protein TatA